MRCALLLSLSFAFTSLSPVGATEQQWLPTPGYTPGAANPSITEENYRQTLCAPGFTTRTIRPPEEYTEGLKKHDLQEPRYTDKNPAHYEQDHLIPLEIGGHPSDPNNLWPQAWNGRCGAHVKDKLENKLHSLVCSGRLDLTTARTAIATNWITAYNKYVGRLQCP